MSVEARVGADRQLPARAGSAHPADRLAQEVGRAPSGIRAALAQSGHEHVARPGGDREQRVVAPHMGIPMVEGAFLLEPVRLADRGIEIDRQGLATRSGAGRPAPGEQLAADPVELPDVTPAEAAQERPEGRRGLDREAEHTLRAAGPQGIRVVDRVATSERGHDERQELVAKRRAGQGCPKIASIRCSSGSG